MRCFSRYRNMPARGCKVESPETTYRGKDQQPVTRAKPPQSCNKLCPLSNPSAVFSLLKLISGKPFSSSSDPNFLDSHSPSTANCFASHLSKSTPKKIETNFVPLNDEVTSTKGLLRIAPFIVLSVLKNSLRPSPNVLLQSLSVLMMWLNLCLSPATLSLPL